MSVALPYRFGVIGLGRHGLKLSECLVASPQKWLPALAVDQSIASYARFQASFHRYHVPFYRSLEQAIADQPVDIMLITTTAPSHVPLAEILIRSGYRNCILIEKPISTNLAAAYELQRLMTETAWAGRAAVDYKRRCAEPYARIFQTQQEGTLGKIQRIEFCRPSKLSMLGSHFVDLADWLFGDAPVEVRGRLAELSQIDHRGAVFFDPPGQVEVTYSGGGKLIMDTTDASAAKVQGLTAWFERGKAHVDVAESVLTIEGPAGAQSWTTDDADRAFRWIEVTMEGLLDPAGGCRPCTVAEAITTLEVMTAATLSSRQDFQPVALPLPPEHHTETMMVA